MNAKNYIRLHCPIKKYRQKKRDWNKTRSSGLQTFSLVAVVHQGRSVSKWRTHSMSTFRSQLRNFIAREYKNKNITGIQRASSSFLNIVWIYHELIWPLPYTYTRAALWWQNSVAFGLTFWKRSFLKGKKGKHLCVIWVHSKLFSFKQITNWTNTIRITKGGGWYGKSII